MPLTVIVVCTAKKWDRPKWTIPSDCRERWLRGRDLNPRPLGYAYHYSFRCLVIPVCGPDFLFILGPASPPLGCLPSSLYTFLQSVSAL